MIGRIVRSIDFERVLGAPSRARSAHFAIHHVAGVPSLPRRPCSRLAWRGVASSVVDDRNTGVVPDAVWVGAVIPKRHAKRSVTRSLLKRQIRAAVARQPELPAGLWVVRLRAPFARTEFASAASQQLRCAAHDELNGLLADAVRRTGRA